MIIPAYESILLYVAVNPVEMNGNDVHALNRKPFRATLSIPYDAMKCCIITIAASFNFVNGAVKRRGRPGCGFKKGPVQHESVIESRAKQRRDGPAGYS